MGKTLWGLTKSSDIFLVCHLPYLMSAFLSCQNVAHFMLYCLKLFEQKGMSNYEVFSTTIELLTECFHKKRNNKAWIFAKIPIGIHEKFRRQLFLTKKTKNEKWDQQNNHFLIGSKYSYFSNQQNNLKYASTYVPNFVH